MLGNREQCMLAMLDALSCMERAFHEYNGEDYDTALISAVRSASHAVTALAMFSNDYPYSDDVANRINDIRRKVNILENDIESGELMTGVNDALQEII